jgi:hypothetical protein
MSCLNSILYGTYILCIMPIYLLPFILVCYYLENPRDIYAFAFLLTLNLPFEASSFPSLFGDNASSISSLTALPSLTPCKFCLIYILCCVFVRYHLNPCHPSIFTLMLIMYQYFNDSSPISVQESCLTPPHSCSFPIPLLCCKSCLNSIFWCAFACYLLYLCNH